MRPLKAIYQNLRQFLGRLPLISNDGLQWLPDSHSCISSLFATIQAKICARTCGNFTTCAIHELICKMREYSQNSNDNFKILKKEHSEHLRNWWYINHRIWGCRLIFRQTHVNLFCEPAIPTGWRENETSPTPGWLRENPPSFEGAKGKWTWHPNHQLLHTRSLFRGICFWRNVASYVVKLVVHGIVLAMDIQTHRLS